MYDRELAENMARSFREVNDRLDRIERFLVAQLIDQRDRLDRERVYLSGSAQDQSRRLGLVNERIETITQQLEELGHAK